MGAAPGTYLKSVVVSLLIMGVFWCIACNEAIRDLCWLFIACSALSLSVAFSP